MKDTKDMQFINHILKNHKHTVILILGVVVLIGLYLSTQSQAATPYAPADTLDPAQGPGDAFVELPVSQWEDSGNNIFYDGGDAFILGNTDGAVQFYIENDSSGTGASSDLGFLNDGGFSGFLSARSSTYSLLSGEQANRFVLSTYVSTDGLSIVGFKSTDDIKLYTGGGAAANLRMTIEADGDIVIPGSIDVGSCTGCGGGGGGWSLTGNSGLVAGTNFIGMTDDVPLVFKVNGFQSGRIESDNDTVNTAIGYQALDSNTTGNGNIALGAIALTSNTTGGSNIAIGYNALADNTTGSDNTAVGNAALANNTVGGLNNSAFGSFALNANTDGADNTALGSEALSSNTSGFSNTAVGRSALFSNNTGNNNTALGYEALYNNASGIRNTAAGFRALNSNTVGAANTSFGYDSLKFNTSGSSNTAVGYSALLTNTTGNNNTSIGYETGLNNSAGSGNIFIGFNAGKTFGSGSNELWIDNVDDATPLIFGDLSTGEVGIGTTTPSFVLDVVGDLNISTGVYHIGGDDGITDSFIVGSCVFTITGGIITNKVCS